MSVNRGPPLDRSRERRRRGREPRQPGPADDGPLAGLGSGELDVRPMRSSDLEGVMEIEEASFSAPWSRRTFFTLMRNRSAETRVAVVTGEGTVGYLALWFAGGEAELGNLAVEPEWRRRGIGRHLVQVALRVARRGGARALVLEVRQGNGPARALYRSAGFSVRDRIRGYYAAPPEDALVMRRLLPDREAGRGRKRAH